jgi:hypothetical protein
MTVQLLAMAALLLLTWRIATGRITPGHYTSKFALLV